MTVRLSEAQLAGLEQELARRARVARAMGGDADVFDLSLLVIAELRAAGRLSGAARSVVIDMGSVRPEVVE